MRPVAEDEEALAVRTPRCWGESVRRSLAQADLLDRALQPAREGSALWFPLRPASERDPAALDDFLRTHDHATTGTYTFTRRTPRIASYRELLTDLPDDLRALLPSSYDIVGHVAVVKLPDPLLPHQTRIAQALLEAHTQVRTVALDAGVQGPLRIRELVVVAGEPVLTTHHKEHGLVIRVPLDKAYFSPRLATERARVAGRIKPQDRVLDLFAGVGAFVCLVARDRDPAALYAVDLNPAATEALRHNLDANGIDPDGTDITVVEGDARAVAPRTADWDHVVMNLPHDAAAFLDVAADCVADHGEVHLYAMVEKEQKEAHGGALAARMDALMQAHGRPTGWTVAEVRHVRNYAPTLDGLAYTLKGPNMGTMK